MSNDSEENRIIDVIRNYGNSKFIAGIKIGISGMEHCCALLTMQPDNKRQKYLRKCIENKIKQMKQKYGI